MASPAEVAAAGILDDSDPLVMRIEAVLRSLANASATTALEDVGLDSPYAETPELSDWLRTKRIEFADKALNRYAEDVRETLVEGQDAGETIQELADRVHEVFDGRKANALTVARTETTGTANYARQDGYLSAALEENTWRTSGDEQVRESHQELEGETVTIGEPFGNGLRFPGDTSTGDVASFANCRCFVTAVVPGTKSYRASWLSRSWARFEAERAKAERQLRRAFTRCVDEQQRRVLAALGA